MASIAGIIISGVILRKFKLESYGCAVFMLICNIVATTALIIHMFVGCPNRMIAGVNVPYADSAADASR